MDRDPIPRDGVTKAGLATGWKEGLESVKATPESVVSALIAAGAECVNYLPRPDRSGWNPTLTTLSDGEKRMLFQGTEYGPNLSADALRAGLVYALPTATWNFGPENGLWMVPYPRFKNGQPDNHKSWVLFLDAEQVQQLRGVLASGR